MQILSHTYELNSFLDDEKYKKKIKKNGDSVLLIEWDNLRKLLWKSNCIVSPGKFIKTIQKIARTKGIDIFTEYSQNDLPEFLLFVVECFHNSLARDIKMTITGNAENETDEIALKCFEMIKKMYSKEYSEIWNMFYAIHVSVIEDLETGEKYKITPEPYFMIDLPIPTDNKQPTLEDCLNYYVEGETLDGENAWFCEEKEKKINIKKKIQLWSLPNILVIDFKRFNNQSKKNQILITFPTDLDLSKYVIGYKPDSYKYELYGVCNHSGSVLGGHYTSFIKNANEKWYHFNDNEVSELDSNDSIVSPKAYVLFYKKC
jgi:ubiquitin C-terminal hydrolase